MSVCVPACHYNVLFSDAFCKNSLIKLICINKEIHYAVKIIHYAVKIILLNFMQIMYD